MPKDSQIDPKEARQRKAKGGPAFTDDGLDGEGRNAKKQSARRDKPKADR